MKCARFAALLVAATLVSSLVAPAGAQTQTASQFYTAYRAAFDKAKKIEDLFPYMAKQTVDQVNATPAGDRPKMFEMMKMMGTITNLRIVKETKTATGASLAVEALDSDKKPTKGTVDIVNEGGAWKVGSENWSS